MSTPSGTLAASQRHKPCSARSAACCIFSVALYPKTSTKAKIWRCYFLDSQYCFSGMGTPYGATSLTWADRRNAGHERAAFHQSVCYPSSFQGNRSAAQLVVAMTANTGVGWAFIPSSRRNLAHKKSDTVSHVGCSA